MQSYGGCAYYVNRAQARYGEVQAIIFCAVYGSLATGEGQCDDMDPDSNIDMR